MRINALVRDGKLYLSLRDAIDLALENNLDLVIARYNCQLRRWTSFAPRPAARCAA